ncbi:MAG: hypothetical protein BAJALOKI1v1_1340010 [Promethearchaeota archaeon]|nr:MAG: hypothetical protein BAJALOKI1v1_1340010 [Candidatus Lokiarchaeota archaeon]
MSAQFDDIKLDAELITEYLPQINELVDKSGNLDEIGIYLKAHFASDGEKIKGENISTPL